MARSAPRRRAEREPRQTRSAVRSREPRAPREPRPTRRRLLSRRVATLLWLLVGVAGLVVLGLGVAGIVTDRIGAVGSLVVTAAYTWGAAGRSGGRPVVFTLLSLAVGAVALGVWNDQLRTAAAVMSAVAAAVLAVMATVPARRELQAVRETVIATVIAALGSLAAIGWDPVVSVSRFQYAVLLITLAAVVALVYRLGAGLHGLGRRGVVVVVVGAVMLAATLLYAEMLRRYGSHGFVAHLADGVTWMRTHLHGYPRPVEALLGTPALVWGTHMRARRRQGWWVCAFGTALTAPVASTLVNPDLGVIVAGVSIAYSLVIGCLLGMALIRADLFLTGSRKGSRIAGARSALTVPGRRAAREAEDASAVRPEPLRTQALL